MASQRKLDHQKELEKLFSKNELFPRIRKEFNECEDFDFRKYAESIGLDSNFVIDLLVQMALRKRADLDTLVGILRHHYNDGQATVDALLKAAEKDLVDWCPELEVFIVKFLISEDVQQELDRFQFPLPMVVRPSKITHNKQTGYLCSSGSVILKQNHHDDDVCLDHLNRVNQIRLCVNHDTSVMVQLQWKNLDKVQPGETHKDFERRKKAFLKYEKNAKDVIGFLIQEGNEFYLTHRYDKRGRIYSHGYYINYQGSPWNKAVLEFADKEYVE